jgi:uncharacterized protein YeaO (DUF488 family)
MTRMIEMKEITKAKLKEWMREERKDYHKYREVGLDEIAEDEAKHFQILKDVLEKKYGSCR